MPELIEWPCDFPECGRLILSEDAICELCHEVRCTTHNTKEDHHCRTIGTKELRREKKANTKRQYLTYLISQLRVYSHHITQQATSLRPGHSCNLNIPEAVDDLLQSGLLAGFNVHIKLEFEDGVRWLLRVRQDRRHRPPKIIRQCSIDSEVATLNTLKKGGIPVPEGFIPIRTCLDDQGQDIPFDYFFYEFLSGSTWRMPKHPLKSLSLPEDRLLQLMEGYGQIQIKLSELRLPVDQIGCLRSGSQPGKIEVGPVIARGCFQTPEPPYLLGPFSSMKDRYLAHIKATLDYILLGAICQFDPIDAYLWHLELEELVNHSVILGQPIKEVYVKHDDEKGDHLMWNEEGKIVGVLDWEWAYVTSKGEAFSSPYIFYESWKYIKGDNTLTKEENMLTDYYERHEKSDLANCVRNGRLYQRLSRIGRYDKVYTKKGFREPFESDPQKDFCPPEKDVDWRVYMIKRYKDHSGLMGMMEKYGFSLKKAEVEAAKWHLKQQT